MRVLGIVGAPDETVATLAEQFVEEFAAEGPTAHVTNLESSPADGAVPDRRGKSADATYGLSEDGHWTATGRERRVAEVLDDLAPDYEYVVLEGFPDATVPGIVVGDVEYAGEVLGTGSSTEDFDVSEVAADLRETEPYETLESLVDRIKGAEQAEQAGAIATFTGRVRAKEDADDEPTTFLEFEKYEGVAEQKMADISEELADRDGVIEVLLHHRSGVIEYGEDIVFVVVLAGHREEAFETVRDGINRLKDEVPIFKKEVTTDEEFWVHDRE
ncbi:molybdopterin synthase [Haloarculaceae archaeon H-GB2-1]|nr:molybdopterin synthase [Haloarculaceae archaeon H-GB1-1]MEA5385689.1 molybdopterin synthase [Haloarculaceae archaeon H-GB11]MEA5407190.1 molybdopterin synthase [Haloarculaceae archaeon H-GB2-1]